MTEDLDKLINLASAMIDGLDGTRPGDMRQVESKELMLKILHHALSIRLLATQAIEIPYNNKTIRHYDFSSGIVITRALFETYKVFHEVFIQPKTDDETTFRYCLWHLRGLAVQEGFDAQTDFGKAQLDASMRRITEMRETLKKTTTYINLSEKEQKNARRGKIPRSMRRSISHAGFSESSFSRMFDYSSSYVHSDGQCAIQIRSADTPQEQIRMFGYPILHAQIIISKLITTVSEKFEKAKAICTKNSDVFLLARSHAKVAEILDDPAWRARARREAHKDGPPDGPTALST